MLTKDSLYVEPFVGGGSVFLGLVQCGIPFRHAVLNDLDSAVSAFWMCMADVNMTEGLAQLIEKTKPTVEEHTRQNTLIESEDIVTRAFAALFLNRCSFSGILTSGPIGGAEQKSKWTVDCRYNAAKLAARVREIARVVAGRIDVLNGDFEDAILDNDEKDSIIYCDAPYYVKGNALYRHGMTETDHDRLACCLKMIRNARFVASYDDAEEILKKFSWAKVRQFSVRYSITGQKRESWEGKREFIICREDTHE
jgi:DNA adenine methylase